MMTDSESAERLPGEGPSSVNAAVRQGYLWNMLNFLLSQGAGIVIFIALARRGIDDDGYRRHNGA